MRNIITHSINLSIRFVLDLIIMILIALTIIDHDDHAQRIVVIGRHDLLGVI